MTDPRCRSGDGCTGKTSDGPAIVAMAETICSACVYDIQKRLEELPHLGMALKCFLGGSMKVAYTSKVSRTPEPQAPMNVWVADLMDEIGDVIDRAEGLRILTLIQKPAEPFIVWHRGIRQKTYLDGVDRALDIRRVHAKVSDIVGLQPQWEKRHAPCPSCAEYTLGNWVGSDQIGCTTEDCEEVMSLSEYESYCIQKANE